MKKQTLKFPSLKELAHFSQTLTGGFISNTQLLTLTANFTTTELQQAQQQYNAVLISVREKLSLPELAEA